MVISKKILLVTPSCLDERIFGEDSRIVPIGLYYIGALLIENGFDTKIINLADKRDDPVAVFKDVIKIEKPSVIGFSVTNPNRWNAMACAKAARVIDPDITIVFGGPAPTFLSDHLFSACPDIDFIVSGEGETTFLELVKQIINEPNGNFKNIDGLIFKKNNTLFKTRPRRPIKNLDTLPHPSNYFVFQHLAMSRGCPGKCTFCGSPEFWGSATIRFHSPQWFAREIQTLSKNGITHFFISDDTFTMDRQRVLEFCSLLIDKNLPITWNAISRVDYIDADLVSAMRKAGCIQLSFGVESGSKKIRKALGKPIEEKKIITAFSLTTSYGILPRAYFIYGSPGETDETIQESIALLKAIRPLSAIFYLLVIFPGTYLYQKALRDNVISQDIWYRKIEDLPWFEVDHHLDFTRIKAFGNRLRSEFYTQLGTFARTLDLVDLPELYPFHADFLSRLAMTFSHGEYAGDKRIKNQDATAKILYERALSYAPEPKAFLGLAMLLQKQKKFDPAVTLLEKGLGHSPRNKDLNTCMGICLMNTGRFTSALSFFKKFKQFPEINHYMTICRQNITGHCHD